MWARVVGTAQQINTDLRTAVSGSRYRFVDNDLNLDLSYITDRIIAMGFPAMGNATLYRNSAADVNTFAERYHGEHWRIFNVSETNYSYPFWVSDQINYSGWSDHHPVPLEHLTSILVALDDWLAADPKNIAMVHCMAGRSRTGTVIICYLLYKKLFDLPQKAIEYFNQMRGESASFILPSQIRCVYNFFQLLKYSERHPDPIDALQLNMTPLKIPTSVMLKKMIVTPILRGSPSGDGCEPVLEIFDSDGLFPGKGPPKFGAIFPEKKYFISENDADQYMEINIDREVYGDVLIRFFHQTHVPGLRPIKFQLFRMYFHTSFQVGMPGETIISFLDFTAADLDSKDFTDEKELMIGRRHPFPEQLRVRLLFEFPVQL